MGGQGRQVCVRLSSPDTIVRPCMGLSLSLSSVRLRLPPPALLLARGVPPMLKMASKLLSGSLASLCVRALHLI